MIKKMFTITTVGLIGLILTASFVQIQAAFNYDEDGAIQAAIQFLKGSPTFKYDGIPGSIEVVDVEPIRTQYGWLVTLRFTSANAGYGDRTGQFVSTVLTDHETRIIVIRNVVASAVTDEVFDEVNAAFIAGWDAEVEEAKRIALEFLVHGPTFSFDGLGESIRVLEVAIAESYPVQYFVSIEFSCRQSGYGDRTGQMLLQVITPHVITVTVSSGEVRAAVIDGVWDEVNQVMLQDEILSPESAVDIVVRYLMENFSECGDAVVPEVWAVTDLTPEGLLGYSTLEYKGEGWTVRVGYPVVWKPSYSIEAFYGEFSWSGTVHQDRSVE